MKSLMLLWNRVAQECAAQCCTSTHRDNKTVVSRVKNEGLSFLTITLPNFGKDFERSLDLGQVSKQDFQGFTWRSGLPVFLQGFLCLVFDKSSGRLLDHPDVEAIRSVRQLTLMFGKMNLLSNEKRIRAAMDGYIECEREIRNTSLSSSDRAAFQRVANIVLGRSLRNLDIICRDPHLLVPKHGPGATADGLKGNRKYLQKSWPMRLDKVFPSVDFLLPSASYYEALGDVDFPEPGDEIPVKVISVPKTQKTPRIIAMEPTAMQYAQQSIQSEIYAEITRNTILNNLIGFLDQEPNQLLAREGSLTGNLATLDLSEASDRVSYQHVDDLLAFTPFLKEVVFACRSTKADVPGHGVIPLAKFASMGSALSFPIEAMVFITLVFLGIERELKRPLTYKDVTSLVGRVRVFGDDIIVPADYVLSVVRTLEDFGLRVNRRKSFWTGKFRESCGKEYYAGHDVSIVRLRRMIPSDRRHVQEIVSLVSTSNQMYFSGYWQTVKLLDQWISELLDAYPVVLPTSPALGRHSFMGFLSQKNDDKLHRPLVRAYVVSGTPPSDILEDHQALLKCFLNMGELPIADVKHLERAGRPTRVNIKRGWTTPY
jgi:hypothetical protein